MLIIFLYSFSSFHWMTYKFYFFEYSIFLEFFEDLQILQYFIMSMLKVTFGLRNRPLRNTVT